MFKISIPDETKKSVSLNETNNVRLVKRIDKSKSKFLNLNDIWDKFHITFDFVFGHKRREGGGELSWIKSRILRFGDKKSLGHNFEKIGLYRLLSCQLSAFFDRQTTLEI